MVAMGGDDKTAQRLSGLSKRRRQKREIDFAIDRIQHTVEQQLTSLHQHKLKLDEHRSRRDFRELHLEQIELSGCIKRLENVLKELDRLTKSAHQDERQYLEDKTEALARQIKSQIETIATDEQLNGDCLVVPQFSESVEFNEPGLPENNVNEQHMSQKENLMLQEEISQRQKSLRSLAGLVRDLGLLKETINSMGGLVRNQGESVDRIENNISTAEAKIRKGEIALASIKKAAGLPLICAAVGTVLAGPIGLVAGFKVGAMTAVGTGAIGYTSGKYVQKLVNEVPPDASRMIKDKPDDDALPPAAASSSSQPDDDNGEGRRRISGGDV